MWIQAIKASLKFTLSHRSSGPCRDRSAVTAPGQSTQRPANKGRGFQQSKPRAEKKRPGASRSSEAVRRGQGEAQAHVLQGTWRWGSSVGLPASTRMGPSPTGLRGADSP